MVNMQAGEEGAEVNISSYILAKLSYGLNKCLHVA